VTRDGFHFVLVRLKCELFREAKMTVPRGRREDEAIGRNNKPCKKLVCHMVHSR